MSIKVSFGFPAAGALPPAQLTIGTFDGLHRGHLSLVGPMIEEAKKAGMASVVVTFEPHPRCVLDPDHCPLSLTTLDEKTWLLDQMGLDYLVVIPFTPQVAALSPASFMRRLMRGIPLRRLVIGYDFRFGHGRRGDAAFLQRLASRLGFSLTVGTPLRRAGEAVSSSSIRRLLLLGQVRAAAQLLGRDYFLRSTVEHGAHRGRVLGYPTANLRITPGKLVPATGIYAVRALVDDRVYGGALSAGFRPTFGEHTLTVEVFLFDFDGDLYGKLLTVMFVQRLRGERRFAMVDSLRDQMAKDVANARRLLA